MTQKILLIRHAIAEERSSRAGAHRDSERALTPEGVQKFKEAARGLRVFCPQIQSIVSSPYLRAWQTAEILKTAYEDSELLSDERLVCGVGVREYLALIGEHASGSGVLAIVAHEPDLGIVFSHLLSRSLDGGGHFFSFKKGGVAFLEFYGAIAEGAATLHWAMPPKALRAAAN